MTNSQFMKSGNQFMVSNKAAMDLYDELPVGTYTVKQNPMTGAYLLEAIEDFELPSKLYGTTSKHADRILATFDSRPNSTGVMLSGEKGSGKTLLAKSISVEAGKKGIPTIVINQPHSGEGFNSFMQMIEQPTVVIFDEFEKVYDREKQEQMLTLLDGVYPSKKLFIITCNDKYRVNEHMKNRPGRIFYRIDYAGLDTAFITEYCEDNLKNKDHIESIARLSVLFGSFNFDILKAMVEEMNRYDETPQEALELLNAKPEMSNSLKYKAKLYVPSIHLSEMEAEERAWGGNPLAGEIDFDYLSAGKNPEDREWLSAIFNSSDLKSVDPATGEFLFANKEGEKLSLVRDIPQGFNYHAL